MELVDAKDAPVQLAKIEFDKADTKAMLAALPPLQAGRYRVRWSVMAHDGQKVGGEFAFRIK